MADLTEYREAIGKIDEQMAALFEERMKICSGIAEYKKEHGLSVKDKAREKALIDRNRRLIKDPEIEEYYVQFLNGMLSLSRAYQERLLTGMKVAYSGVEGAYAYIAAKTMFHEASLECKNDFASAYRSVENGDCDCAVLPLENSYAGEVSAVLDLAFSGTLFVDQVVDLPIRHCLLGVPGSSRESIRTVISHPQALQQCSDYVRNHGFSTREYGNTALAAQKVLESNDPSLGAIASKETAKLNGLTVLDENVQDSGINTTRFAVFSRTMDRGKGTENRIDDNFILVFTVRNEAGSLAQTLNIIGAHGYNMKSVRSRPMKELLWKYFFFAEIEGNINTRNGQDMLKELSAICGDLKLLGSYHACVYTDLAEGE
ncbi:MAG: chorismate mutase [Lachnospiraceae bacterium]|nr:chorismate mutase [Lachnospiraceae bacterium]